MFEIYFKISKCQKELIDLKIIDFEVLGHLKLALLGGKLSKMIFYSLKVY